MLICKLIFLYTKHHLPFEFDYLIGNHNLHYIVSKICGMHLPCCWDHLGIITLSYV